MPGDSEHPVTVLGDLRVNERRTANHVTYGRPATVADLVSALRAEGIEGTVYGVERYHPDVTHDPEGQRVTMYTVGRPEVGGRYLLVPLADALAEAQPFPPAGDVS